MLLPFSARQEYTGAAGLQAGKCAEQTADQFGKGGTLAINSFYPYYSLLKTQLRARSVSGHDF